LMDVVLIGRSSWSLIQEINIGGIRHERCTKECHT
jgi:hypothetical protein